MVVRPGAFSSKVTRPLLGSPVIDSHWMHFPCSVVVGGWVGFGCGSVYESCVIGVSRDNTLQTIYT